MHLCLAFLVIFLFSRHYRRCVHRFTISPGRSFTLCSHRGPATSTAGDPASIPGEPLERTAGCCGELAQRHPHALPCRCSGVLRAPALLGSSSPARSAGAGAMGARVGAWGLAVYPPRLRLKKMPPKLAAEENAAARHIPQLPSAVLPVGALGRRDGRAPFAPAIARGSTSLAAVIRRERTPAMLTAL